MRPVLMPGVGMTVGDRVLDKELTKAAHWADAVLVLTPEQSAELRGVFTALKTSNVEDDVAGVVFAQAFDCSENDVLVFLRHLPGDAALRFATALDGMPR